MPAGAMNINLFRDNIFGLDKSPMGEYVEALKAQALFESNPILQQAKQMDMEEQKLRQEQGMAVLGQILQALQPQAKITTLEEQDLPDLTQEGFPGDSLGQLPDTSVEGFPDDSLVQLPNTSIEGVPDDSLAELPNTSIEGVPSDVPDVVKDKGFVTQESDTDDPMKYNSAEEFVKAQIEPSDIWNKAHGTTTYKVFRGETKGTDAGDYGKGTYFTGDVERAKAYGKVSEHTVELKNPKVFQTTEEARDWRRSVVGDKLLDNPQSQEASLKIDQALRKDGFDGVVVFDKNMNFTDKPDVPFEVVKLAQAQGKAEGGDKSQQELLKNSSIQDTIDYANAVAKERKRFIRKEKINEATMTDSDEQVLDKLLEEKGLDSLTNYLRNKK